MKNNLLTTTQAAEQLGLSVKTIRSMIHSGRLTAINVSAANKPHYRIRQSDLHKFL